MAIGAVGDFSRAARLGLRYLLHAEIPLVIIDRMNQTGALTPAVDSQDQLLAVGFFVEISASSRPRFARRLFAARDRERFFSCKLNYRDN